MDITSTGGLHDLCALRAVPHRDSPTKVRAREESFPRTHVSAKEIPFGGSERAEGEREREDRSRLPVTFAGEITPRG